MSLEEIEKLINEMKSFPVDDKKFTEMFSRACELFAIDEDGAAETIGVSKPTFRRWKKGLATPHPVIQETIFRVMLKKYNEKGWKK